MSFAMYLIGTLLLISGLGYGAHLAGVASQWIAVGALVLAGIGIMAAVSKTRQKDPPSP